MLRFGNFLVMFPSICKPIHMVVQLNFFFRHCSLMIVIDLTAPFDMWDTFYTLLDNARVIVDSAMQQFVKRSPDSYEAFMNERKTVLKEYKVCIRISS